jgi:endonuclease YncB( thermonuclease family)
LHFFRFMGVLKIEGVIRLEQFWPRGKSEADASKIKITVNKNSFNYSANSDDAFERVTLYDDAYIDNGRKKQKLIKRGNQILVRLQGIDTPELDYKQWGPTPLKHPTKRGNLFDMDYQQLIIINNAEGFRQPLAETCLIKLTDLLKKEAKGGEVPCVFTSVVNNIKDVCDVYGRFVGNLQIKSKGKPLDVNLWMLEKGWALPALYDSMTHNEIEDVLHATEKAKNAGGNLYSSYKEYLGIFDYSLRYREPAQGRTAKTTFTADKGHLIHPKLYRRWCAYHTYKLAKVDIGSFADYLRACGDEFYFTADFINTKADKPPQAHALLEIIKGNRLTQPPEDIVFKEKKCELKGVPTK